MPLNTVLPKADLVAPGLWRRLACFVYEGVLLFGVLMIAGYFYSTLTQQRHALQGRHGLQAFLFVVLGVYFAWFWSHGGQTVAMKAWRIRLVDRDGRRVSEGRAMVRYLLSWLWFLPALLVAYLLARPAAGTTFVALAIGVVAWSLLSWLNPSRQFVHDLLAGTRLVAVPHA